MGEFARGLHERVAETRRSLAAAEADGDDYGVAIHGEELANLVRLGREHGLEVDASADRAVVDVTDRSIDLTDPAARAAC